MSEFLPPLYILLLTVLGWVLSLLKWQQDRKWLAAIAAVLGVPSLFIVPAITHPHAQFADLQLAVGITALVWGAAALGIGWGGTILLRRWRDRRG